MRLPDWKTSAGYLAVIAALALSLPGVRAVRADDEVAVISVNLVDFAPSCDPNSDSGTARSAKVFLLEGDSDPGVRAAAIGRRSVSAERALPGGSVPNSSSIQGGASATGAGFGRAGWIRGISACKRSRSSAA